MRSIGKLTISVKVTRIGTKASIAISNVPTTTHHAAIRPIADLPQDARSMGTMR